MRCCPFRLLPLPLFSLLVAPLGDACCESWCWLCGECWLTTEWAWSGDEGFLACLRRWLCGLRNRFELSSDSLCELRCLTAAGEVAVCALARSSDMAGLFYLSLTHTHTLSLSHTHLSCTLFCFQRCGNCWLCVLLLSFFFLSSCCVFVFVSFAFFFVDNCILPHCCGKSIFPRWQNQQTGANTFRFPKRESGDARQANTN